MAISISLKLLGFAGNAHCLCSFVFACLFRWGNYAESRFFACTTQEKIISLADREDGIEDLQHCIVIPRGKEGRIPKTASVIGTNLGLKSFSYCFCVFPEFCRV